MSYEIELKKYNLPEGWNPEAADFLVKLLIKNPLYRLGRYGSFQRIFKKLFSSISSLVAEL